MTKFNKSRRSVANERVNTFLNNKSVGIKAVNISEAGNIEIKFIAWYLTSAQLKLRVNLTTLTFVFEHYGTRYQQGIRGVTMKRKAIDTNPIGDKNFFQNEMLAFLEANSFTTKSKLNETFKDLYMVQWGDPFAQVEAKSETDLYDAMAQAHVMYAKMAINEDAVNLQGQIARMPRHPMYGDELEKHKQAMQLQYEQLQRERDNTPLFSDEQYDRWIEGKGQPTTLISKRIAVDTFTTLDGRPVEVDACAHLTQEDVDYLLERATKPKTKTKLQEIMENMQADGSVTVTIDMTKDNVTLVDAADTVRMQINKPKKGD